MTRSTGGIRRVSLRASLAIGAAFTVSAFAAGFLLAFDGSGTEPDDAGTYVQHEIGPRSRTTPDVGVSAGARATTPGREGAPIMCSDPAPIPPNPGPAKGAALGSGCRLITEYRASPGEAADALRWAADRIEGKR